IRETLPTLRFLCEHDAKVILMAHFGRPKGKPVAKYSLAPVAERLAELLERPVEFSPETVGESVEHRVAHLQPRDVLLLENVRFHAEEEKNDPAFSQALARLGDVYVNDAFGAAHRAHASTAGVAGYIGESAMGLLMEKELKYLQEELADPPKPFVVILGGSKVSDKIGVIKALMQKADTFLIGGAMAFTFFKAQGIPIGESRVEADKLDLAREILALAKEKNVKFLLPVDSFETQEIKPGAGGRNTPRLTKEKGISDGWQGVDIGKETVEIYKKEIAGARTVLWNGPVGIFEIPDFANGTFSLAKALAENRAAITIIGGGDSVTAVKQAGLAEKMTFISTGGGASLELLEGKELPGVAALSDK
ncbi:MAG: phosphoglycerate kinase, partial [Verrucomicrobia bacterium]|nr:phosphoglycerate kinase [Verrucomicrobiota bacterium]